MGSEHGRSHYSSQSQSQSTGVPNPLVVVVQRVGEVEFLNQQVSQLIGMAAVVVQPFRKFYFGKTFNFNGTRPSVSFTA